MQSINDQDAEKILQRFVNAVGRRKFDKSCFLLSHINYYIDRNRR